MRTYTFTYKIKNIVPGTSLLNVKYTPNDERLTPINVKVPIPEGYEEMGAEHYINLAAPVHFWANEEESRGMAESLQNLIGTVGSLTKEAPPETQNNILSNPLEITHARLGSTILRKGGE